MRYLNIPDIEFTNVMGTTRNLKGLRPIVKYARTFEVSNKGEDIDYIAVRSYGNDAEPLWYRMADQNIEKIVSRKFRLNEIEFYQVPVE